MAGESGWSSKPGFLGRIKKVVGHSKYTTEEVAELSKKAGELTSETRTSLINTAIKKLETGATKGQSYEKQAALAGALVRTSDHWDDKQTARIRDLMSAHEAVHAIVGGQILALDNEQMLRSRRLNVRPPRSSSRDR
ncbi:MULTISPECIES: hypothetical protein [Rhizobium]|uniref:hypothetical protein n=1 Tax=Rhizobium TaxID=379 RepID=UPI001C83B73F|nr:MULTISPECIES: hypothetical protein [Rhizobium]MBX4899716.1 hypothetical protein [Rhizobium bangladeshense]MBX5297634.1 hypothetical protein [Rhizobium sp. NLR15a]